MRRVWQVKAALVCGLAAFGLLVVSASRQAEARPQYLKAFTEKYSEVEKANDIKKTIKCGVCHPGQKKTDRNAYGKALGEALKAGAGDAGIPKAGIKDAKAIDAGLKKAEESKSETDGKTFGDLLKAKELPAKNEKK